MDDSRRAQIADALLAAVLCLATIALLLDPTTWISGMAYGGDEIQTLVLAQAAIEEGHPLMPSRLNAPFGGDWRRFPMRTPLETLLIQALGQVGLSCFSATTLTWALWGGLTAATATLAFRMLIASRPLTVLLGNAYALQPFFWDRYTAHFHLHSPWLPLIAAGCIQLSMGGWPARAPRRLLWACFLQGTAGLYMTYFSGLVAAAALVSGWSRGGKRALRQAIPLGLALGIGLLFQILPMMFDRPQAQGTGRLIVDRNLFESDFYALKLRHLISPRPGHPFPPLSWLERKLQVGFGDDHNEAQRARLGSLGSLGLALCAWLLWRALLRSEAPPSPTPWLSACCGLALFCFLLGTVGGLGSLANLVISEKFRCLNRCVVFLQFFCLAGLGGWIERSGRKSASWSWLLLIPLVAWDQFMPPPGKLPHRHDAFLLDRAWIGQVESRLKPGASVFQTPEGAFGRVDGMAEGYDAAKGYLHSRQLRWSHGSLPNRLSPETPSSQLLQEWRNLNFDALCVDRLASATLYPALAEELRSSLGDPSLVSANQRYWLFLPPSTTPPAPRVLENSQDPQVPLSNEVARQVEMEYPLRSSRGEQVYPTQWLRLSLLVHNRSSSNLSARGNHPLRLSYHWVNSRGKKVVYDGERTPLPDMRPGETRPVVLPVLTPTVAGHYRLQPRLVQEGVRWMEGEGYQNLEIPVKVRWW